MALRHNIKMVDIINTLDQSWDGFNTLLFHMKKLLSEFIPDGTKVKKEKCPECNRSTLVYQEGCHLCTNCG